MQPHQQRVVDERDVLYKKAESFSAFLQTDAYKTVRPNEQLLLVKQLAVMAEYLIILNSRIALFEVTRNVH